MPDFEALPVSACTEPAQSDLSPDFSRYRHDSETFGKLARRDASAQVAGVRTARPQGSVGAWASTSASWRPRLLARLPLCTMPGRGWSAPGARGCCPHRGDTCGHLLPSGKGMP
jgi:hypothetical protein